VKHICKKLALNYQNNLVIRHKATEKQVGKTGVERRKNLKNAFSLNPNLTMNTKTLPEQVIIFDDVVTTGTTVNELAKLLKKSGVKHIIVIAIALAIEKI
jgi:predicted amidophosphoribosyltransferase